MRVFQDTARVNTPPRDTVLQDTVRIQAGRSTLSDLDSVMIRAERRESSVTVQSRPLPAESKKPPAPLEIHYFNNDFWQGYRPAEFLSLFPDREEKYTGYDIHPVPVLINDDLQSARQAGKNYLLYLSRSDNDYQTETIQAFPSWTLYVVLLSFLTITLLRMAYARFLEPILNAVLSHRETIHLYTNRNSITQNTSIILQFLFLLNGSFFLFLTGSYLGIMPDIPDFYILISLLAGLFFLYQLKYLFLYLLGFFFDQLKAFTEYIHSISVFNKVLGLLLIPVTAGLTIMSEHFAAYFIYTGVSVIVLSYLIRITRGAKIILDNGFSVFYMFLYLCALEILPLLIVYKLLQS